MSNKRVAFRPNMAYGAYRQADLERLTITELKAVHRAAYKRFNSTLERAWHARTAGKKLAAMNLERLVDYYELLTDAAFGVICDRKEATK
jgi:hypothetical protein